MFGARAAGEDFSGDGGKISIPDPRESIQQQVASRKEVDLQAVGGGGGGGYPSSKILSGVPGIRQVCSNYCGPAATQEILRYKGVNVSQYTIADWEGTGACGSSSGTCLVPIRDVLNDHLPNLPYANYYVAYHLDDDTINATARDLGRG
ncbi:hypothetical protein Tter_2848 [Thermobaculum terrenum ATCC BAA-798]|uniref:Peptidase C39-like domain-containing protein n=1 Tax=Thermobaculum terrenum (strain ATCC BAA-798 / CCMEE 7001 / YNP1) TaxID=525904 RepID=D1CJ11_THET1|nr:C39 family peptidase [Thermobaculum terrenum]ACZ43731.1 hypothetical protein Tter_2848 [Thermobaculum terrenum ATCC BAA-798]